MDLRKQFTFDNPEDSYWNENERHNSFFDDTNAATARRVLDDLYDVTFELEDEQSNLGSEAGKDAEIHDNSDESKPSIFLSESPKVPMMSAVVAKQETPMHKPRRALGSCSMMSDSSFTSFTSDATVHLDYARLKAEHHKLQKYLDKVRQERFEPPSIQTTIKRLKNCEKVSLDFYKSKQDKMELLEAAIETQNKDVILMVVLFIKRTLIPNIFRQILVSKPEAAEIYFRYLREINDIDELVDGLLSIGRTDEACIVELGAAFRKCHPTQKLSALRGSMVSAFRDPAVDAKAVDEHVHLMECQIPIDAADEEEAKAGTIEVFKQFPKKACLIGQPLLTTLYYCCLYHYNLPANNLASPLAFKQTFGVPDRAFFWMAASALSRRQHFAEIDRLLVSKKMLVSQKVSCPVPWPMFFQLLAKYGAPPAETLSKWLRAVPDVRERLKVAELFGEQAADVQIDAVAAIKDRQKLVLLMNKLNPRSVEYNKAQLLLANAANKWKN